MKKIFKLANGELNKIFLRPMTYVVLVGIIALLYISSTIFNPTISVQKLTYGGSSDIIVYNNFVADTSIIKNDGGSYVSVALENAKTEITNFISIDDKLSTLKGLVENCYAKYNKHNESLMENAILTLSNSPSQTNQAKDAFIEFKTSYVTPVYNYLLTTAKNDLNFFISQSKYEELLKFFYNFGKNIPDNYNGYTSNAYINRYEYLTKNYNFSKSVYPILNSVEQIVPKTEELNTIIENYYVPTQTKLSNTYDKIYDYYLDAENNKDLILDEIAKYNSIANAGATFLKNKLLLSIAGSHTDSFMQDKIDYIGFRRYEIQDKLNRTQYLLDNDLQDYNFLSTFKFDESSGTEANAFDFTFYAMRIASIAIIIYLFFTIASNVAEEQSKGTIKLLAIRQLSRNKIISGKYLGTILYGLFLTLFSMVSAFIIGCTIFGIPTITSVLTSFNAGASFIVSGYLLLLISAALYILNIMFFTSIALLIAMITKSGAVTIFASSVGYVLALIGNGYLMNGQWFKAVPSSHIDLFKYFGGTSNGILGFSLAPDASFILSIVVVFLSIGALNAVSHLIFLKRDIA